MGAIVLPNPDKVRMIISDLDGTLLNSKHEISEKTIKTINSIIDKYKVNFVIATGKTHYSSLHLREKLNIANKPNCPSIHNNGSTIYDDKNKIIKEFFLDSEVLIQNIELFKNHIKGKDYSYTLYSGDSLYCPKKDKWFDFLADYGEPVKVMDEETMLEKIKNNTLKVNKICLLADPNVINEMRPILEDFSKNYPDVGITVGNSCCLETLNINGHKGRALETIMEMLNIKPDQVMAFGDGINDITMFQTAGYKYAMGNCVNELRSIATSITKTNDEDGLAYILEETFMKNNKNNNNNNKSIKSSNNNNI